MKGIKILLGFIIALVTLVSGVSSAAPVYYSGNGHYYEAISVPSDISWENAKTAAESLSYLGVKGHLATITSPDENEFIVKNINGYNCWLGGIQQDGNLDPASGWQWVTGEQWDYTNWAVGEPNDMYGGERGVLPSGSPENALEFGGYWNDYPSVVPVDGYIVEYDTFIWPTRFSNLVNCVFYDEYKQYGYESVTRSISKKPHEGIDTASGEPDTEVIAASEGKVSFSGVIKGYGECIEIKHPNGYNTFYAHLSKRLVNEEADIKAGTPIGLVGGTSGIIKNGKEKLYGPHLHFEIRKGSQKVNPLDFYDRTKLILPSPEWHNGLIGIPGEVDGKVVEVVSDKFTTPHARGYVKIIDLRDKNLVYEYTDLNDIYVKKNERVREGQLIADKF